MIFSQSMTLQYNLSLDQTVLDPGLQTGSGGSDTECNNEVSAITGELLLCAIGDSLKEEEDLGGSNLGLISSLLSESSELLVILICTLMLI